MGKSVENTVEEDIRKAVATLSRSERGRQALSNVFALLDRSGLGLDDHGRWAVEILLQGAMGGFAGTVLDELRTALGKE